MVKKWSLLLVLSSLLFVDRQLTFILNSFITDSFFIGSHLFLIALIYVNNYFSSYFLLAFLILFGSIFDIQFLSFYPIMLLTNLGLFLILNSFKKTGALKLKYSLLLSIVISVFYIEMIPFLLAKLLSVTTYPIWLFVGVSLMPTLVFNLLCYFLIAPFLSPKSNEL